MKNSLLIQLMLLMIFFSISCHRNTNEEKLNNLKDSTIQNKHKWLKEYALCSCIKYSLKNDTSLKNDLSFVIYKEITDYGNPSVYQIIDSASSQVAINIKPSQVADYNKKKAFLNGCIEYYQSEKLDSLVKSFDHSLIKSH